VVLHLRYTASEGGNRLKVEAVKSLKTFLKDSADQSQQGPFALLFNLRHDFPTEWAAYIANEDSTAKFTAIIQKSFFPYFAQDTQNWKINIGNVNVVTNNSSAPQPVDDAPTGDISTQAKFDVVMGSDLLNPGGTGKPAPSAVVFLIINYSLTLAELEN